MKRYSVIGAVNIGFIFLLMVSTAANASEIKVLSGFGMRDVMNDLGPKFEHATGNKLEITYAQGDPIIKRVQDGETFDVVISNQGTIASLVKNGKAANGNVTVLANAGLGVAVRKGAPKPDISSPEAFKRALLAAKSITYSPGGVSGADFTKVLDRLGITSQMKSKIVFPKGGDEGGYRLLVANGKAEIVVSQAQSFISVTGIEFVGPLPGDLQLKNVLSAAVMNGTSNKELSKVLVDFLRTPEAIAAFKAKGMEPATP